MRPTSSAASRQEPVQRVDGRTPEPAAPSEGVATGTADCSSSRSMITRKKISRTDAIGYRAAAATNAVTRTPRASLPLPRKSPASTYFCQKTKRPAPRPRPTEMTSKWRASDLRSRRPLRAFGFHRGDERGDHAPDAADDSPDQRGDQRTLPGRARCVTSTGTSVATKSASVKVATPW